MYTFSYKSENLRMLENILEEVLILPRCSFYVIEHCDGKTTEKKIRKFCQEDKNMRTTFKRMTKSVENADKAWDKVF